MIKPNKQYKVFDVRKGKTGTSEYTIVKIRDAIPNKDGTFTKEYFSVFVNANVCVYNNAQIVFTIIDGVRKKVTNYNGKFLTEVTIFVSPENFKVDTIGDAPYEELQAVGEQDLPF